METIKSIKVCSTARDDLIGWHYTKDGMYTVKSAYWLATHLPGTTGTHPPPGDIKLKQLLWKTKTAPKIKHFCWKILSGAIATGEMLRYRHINKQSICKRCCRDEETSQHLFFECDYAKATWRGAGLPNLIFQDSIVTLEEKFRAMFTFNPSTTNYWRQLPFWILWRLWRSRNILTFQQKHIPWEVTVQLAKQDALEWQDIEDRVQVINPLSRRHSNRYAANRWTRPVCGWKKCNYDGSYSTIINSKAGWVIRDEHGQFIGGGQAKGKHTNNALESALQALIIAMQSCWSHGHTKVCFEGDNIEVYQILNEGKARFDVYNWIRDIQAWKRRFQECRFLWINRRNNKPADTLAKGHLQQHEHFKFYSFIPPVIFSALHLDSISS